MNDPNVNPYYDPSIIGSPRMMSPRSHRSQRTHRTRRSGSGSGSRQRQEQYTGTTRYASQPAPPFPQPEFQSQSEPQYPPDPDPNYNDNNARTGEDEVPENLHQDYASFNVDPAGPILGGAGGDSIRQAEEDEQQRGGVTGNNFVGGFVGTLKHALSQGRSRGRGRRRGGDVEAAYGDGYGYKDGRDGYDTPRDPNFDSEPSPSSETMHGGTVEYADDGTTAVDHQVPMLNPGHYVTPVIAVPQLAPDYAKMGLGSPSDSDAYTDAYADAYANGHTSSNQYPNTYMSRFTRFLRHLNDLPWVAESRVTVDYYPGQQSKRRGARSRSRTAGGRPILSWYNRHAFLGKRNTTIGSLVDLDLNASPVPPQKPEPTPLMVQMDQYPYPQTQNDNNKLDQPIYLPTVPISPSEIDPANAYYAEPINLPHPIHLPTPIPTNLEPAVIPTNLNSTVPQATTPADPTIPLTHPNSTLPSSFPLPPPPPRSEAGHSARTSRTARTTGGRSIVYSVMNPSAPSGSSTTSSSAGVTSPLVSRPPPPWVNQRVGMGMGTDNMTAIAQSATGYTPSQPQASRYGRGVHEAATAADGVSYQV